jgi:PTH2 family peptidyl-tRNA hydrolase
MKMHNVKEVMVMREKFPNPKTGQPMGMNKGKFGAQCAHAAMAWLTRRMHKTGQTRVSKGMLMIEYVAELSIPESDWKEELFTKVVLGVETEEELLDTFERAKAAGIEAHLITDAGLTEFGGVPTNTAVGLGPDYAGRIDIITGPEAVTCLGKKYKLL